MNKPLKAFERIRVSTSTTGPTLTKQAAKAECDINQILRKYVKTGLMTHINEQSPQYGDFSNPPLYQDAMNRVIEAQKSFMTLPAAIRKRFNNDPAEFLEFVSQPDSLEELRKMGLATTPTGSVAEPPVSVATEPKAPEEP